jgi:polysaccharide deacetylase family protein (PEP-CTERM system associated)
MLRDIETSVTVRPKCASVTPGTRAVPALRPSVPSIANAMTIDVEDYFQVSAFAARIPRSEWGSLECRVERNVERALTLLADAGAAATFFTLGWLAERYPKLVRDIAESGHEVASHGFAHERASAQTRAAFLGDVRLAKRVIEDATGHEVWGYRAPSFSIGRTNDWAFAVLEEAGYRYSSSVYPIRHDHYGIPDAPRFAYAVRPGLLEVPIATVRMLNTNWPAGGGGYFRLFPYALSSWSIRRINRLDHRPAMFYFHPWELDPDQPRVASVGLKSHFRHYVNLRRTAPRLVRLLRDFRWERADRIYLSAA